MRGALIWSPRRSYTTEYGTRTARPGLESGELTGMGADEVRLDGCLAVVGQQVLEFHPRVKRDFVDVADELRCGFSAAGSLVGPLERGYDIVGEIAGELRA